MLQAYGFLALLNYNGVLTGGFDLASFETLTQIATLTAGAIALMWIGELITERGIGNGISFIIFAGIVSRAPGAIRRRSSTAPNIAAFIAFGAVAIAAVGVIIYIQEGQRRIPIQYASRVRGRRMYQGGQTFLPLRVNQAGVIPIIFAVSILLFPQQLASYFTGSEITIVAEHRDRDRDVLQFERRPVYIVLYFFLTMGFTYFYTAFTFKPDETAEQLRKNGGFIPGIRPGRPTQDYLARVVTRITFAGALFLAIVAVSPLHRRAPFPDLATLGLGGTSLLIVVSVVVETHEADRSATDDAELRGLHPVTGAATTEAPRTAGTPTVASSSSAVQDRGKGTQAAVLSRTTRAAARRHRRPLPGGGP